MRLLISLCSFLFVLLLQWGFVAVAQDRFRNPGEHIDIEFFVDGKPTPLPPDIGFTSAGPVGQNELLREILKTGRFRNGLVYEERQPSGGTLWTVFVERQREVRGIEFEGVPFGEELEYSRMIRTKVGDAFNWQDLELDKVHVKERLRDRGYLKSTVETSIVEESGDDGEVGITFKVTRGRPCRVSGLLIEPGIQILNLVTSPVEPGSMCDIPAIKDSLERQRNKLINEGYLSTDFRFLGINYSLDLERAIVRLRMERGPRTRLEVYNVITGEFIDVTNGREAISYSDIQFMTEEDLRADVQKIFQKKGHARVVLNGPTKVTDAGGNIVMRFEVQPGPQMYVRNVQIKGALPRSHDDLVDGLEMNKELLSRRVLFDELELPKYQERLREIYLEEGFADAEVSFPVVSYTTKENEVTLMLNVEAGKRYYIEKASVEGFPSDFKARTETLTRDFRQGEPLVKSRLQELVQELRVELLQQGYAYADASVEISKMSETENAVMSHVIIKVTSGPVVRIRHIFAEGELYRKEKAIIRETSLAPGDLYTPDNLERARQRLLKHGLFGNVEVTPFDPSSLERREREIDLVVRTRSRGNYSLGLVPGWSSLSGYRFTVEYAKNNITSDGLRLFSSGTLSQENHQQTYSDRGQLLGRRLSLGVVEPMFRLGGIVTPLDVSVSSSFGAEVQPLFNREFLTVVQDTTWRPYFWDRSWAYSVKFQHESSKFITSGLPLIETLDQRNGHINEVILSAALDTRNNLEWPTSGGLFEVSGAFARFGLYSEVQYDRYTGDANIFYPVYRRFSGAISFGASQIANVVNAEQETVTAPGSRRATLTGHTQVRGFPERTAPLGPLLWVQTRDAEGNTNQFCGKSINPIGATNVLYLKHEVRYRSPFWSNNLGFAWFVDTGSAYFTDNEEGRIQQELSAINPNTKSGGDCVVEKARLVGNDSIQKGKPRAVVDYFNTSYVSSGLGTRLIIPHFASVNLDWGLPLRDPADRQNECVAIQDATASDEPPSCVNRRKNARFLKYLPGAFHINIGAAF